MIQRVYPSGGLSEAQIASLIATHAIDADAHHDNANDPSAGQKAALVGTNSTPGSGNKYVTNSDPRLGGGVSLADVDKGEQGVVVLDTAGYDGSGPIYVSGYSPIFPAGDRDARFSEVVNANHPIDESELGKTIWTVSLNACDWWSGSHTAPHLKFTLPFLGDWFMRCYIVVVDTGGGPGTNNIGGALGIKQSNDDTKHYCMGFSRNGGFGRMSRYINEYRNNTGLGAGLVKQWVALKKSGDAFFFYYSGAAEGSPPDPRSTA